MKYKVFFAGYPQPYGIMMKKWWWLSWKDYGMYFSNKDHAERYAKELSNGK